MRGSRSFSQDPEGRVNYLSDHRPEMNSTQNLSQNQEYSDISRSDLPGNTMMLELE